jgi:hypothetical protein
MARIISVTKMQGDRYRATIRDGMTHTMHEVVVTPEDVARYAPGTAAGRLVRASVEFLLEHQHQDAIESRLDPNSIAVSFPDYASAMEASLE